MTPDAILRDCRRSTAGSGGAVVTRLTAGLGRCTAPDDGRAFAGLALPSSFTCEGRGGGEASRAALADLFRVDAACGGVAASGAISTSGVRGFARLRGATVEDTFRQSDWSSSVKRWRPPRRPGGSRFEPLLIAAGPSPPAPRSPSPPRRLAAEGRVDCRDGVPPRPAAPPPRPTRNRCPPAPVP